VLLLRLIPTLTATGTSRAIVQQVQRSDKVLLAYLLSLNMASAEALMYPSYSERSGVLKTEHALTVQDKIYNCATST